jgi:hypothetical protein
MVGNDEAGGDPAERNADDALRNEVSSVPDSCVDGASPMICEEATSSWRAREWAQNSFRAAYGDDDGSATLSGAEEVAREVVDRNEASASYWPSCWPSNWLGWSSAGVSGSLGI